MLAKRLILKVLNREVTSVRSCLLISSAVVGLMLTLARAKNQGELNPDANLDIMADFFESTLAGIRMAAKAGKKRRALRNIAAFSGRAYMGSDR
jgi:hypothetical protein